MNKEEFKRALEKNNEIHRRRANALVQQTSFKEKRSIVRDFFKKADKKEYHRYRSWPKALRKAALYGILVFGIYKGLEVAPEKVQNYQRIKALKANNNLKNNQVTNVETDGNNIQEQVEKKYLISNRKTFDELYEAALPLIQISLFSVECCAIDPYSDRDNASLNTAGIGLFYYPSSGKAEDTKWIKTSEYIQKHGAFKESVQSSFEKVDGWYTHLDNGAVKDDMYSRLKGSELNIHEFAAIASVRFGGKKNGRDLCDFVRRHYKDPDACAKKIISYPVPSEFPGLDKRHLHEAYLYLNSGGGYVDQMYRFGTKLVTLSRGGQAYSAAVMQMTSSDVQEGKTALISANSQRILKAQDQALMHMCRGNTTIADVVSKEISDKKYRDNILKYYFNTKEDIDLEEAIQIAQNIESAQTNEVTAKKTSKRFGSKATIAMIGTYRSGGR